MSDHRDDHQFACAVSELAKAACSVAYAINECRGSIENEIAWRRSHHDLVTSKDLEHHTRIIMATIKEVLETQKQHVAQILEKVEEATEDIATTGKGVEEVAEDIKTLNDKITALANKDEVTPEDVESLQSISSRALSKATTLAETAKANRAKVDEINALTENPPRIPTDVTA